MSFTDRVFLHVDMDAFFASVEQLDHPELKGKPVVVGAGPDERGVISAASYEARKYGIHSAMPSREAYRCCPHAVFLPVNGKRYRDVSRHICSIFERFTPYVEQVSVDEAFLDVTSVQYLHGDGPTIGQKIKQVITDETGLTASVGIATNKFLAKLASDMDKPDGLTIVPTSPLKIREFMAPLPVGRIWGVGKVTRQSLEQIGIKTIGDLQSIPEERLSQTIGRHAARSLKLLAVGEDSREIETEHEEKSISREFTFKMDCHVEAEIRKVLRELLEDVGQQLREAGKYAEVVHLKIRWDTFKTLTRQKKLSRAVCDDFNLHEAVMDLFNKEELIRPVRLIGCGVSHLVEQSVEQLDLFALDDTQKHQREEQLSHTVDQIRNRFGDESIKTGSIADKKKSVKKHRDPEKMY